MNFSRYIIKPRRSAFFSILLLAGIGYIGGCSGDDDAAVVSKNTKAADSRLGKSQESKEVIEDQLFREYAESDSYYDESTGEQEQDIARDDAATESQEEAAAEQYDEYAYEDEEPSEVVTLRSRSEGYVGWQAPSEMAYSEAEVTLVGPDGRRQKHTFAPGEAIAVEEALPDGLYQWESVIVPEIDPSVQEMIQEVRGTGNFEAQQAMMEELRANGSLPTEEEIKSNRQSGGFVVRDGVATPTTTAVDKTSDGGY